MKYQKAMEKIYKNKHISKQNTLFSQLCLDLILGLSVRAPLGLSGLPVPFLSCLLPPSPQPELCQYP
jgi:hypothetical protein